MLERILVIDDEIDFAAFLRAGCEALGHTVEVCHSAAAARGRIASFDPDVLILDVVMPDEDGIELLQWLSCHGLRARPVARCDDRPTQPHPGRPGEEHRRQLQ